MYPPDLQPGLEPLGGSGYDPIEAFNTLVGDVRDPYPEFIEKRKHEPVQKLSLFGDAGPSSYLVYRHDDVEHILRDNVTFSSSNLVDVMGPVMGRYIILGMDEPEHRRHRALVSTAFRQKVLARWESDLVQQIVDSLIDRFVDRGRAELVREFTFLFPVQVIAGVLGLERKDYPMFQRCSLAVITFASDLEKGLAASKELKEYFARILEQRRVEPRDDLISDLAHAELDGERLHDEEIFSFLRLLLPAGVETTYRASGNFLFGLLTHTDQLDALREDRSLMQQAIEESLRWEPPLLITSRITATDTEIAGVSIPKGASITVMLGSANRDETVHPDPDRFDIFRTPQPHISFGHGPHVCLGMHLARMETRVAVNRLLDRLPNLRLDPDADDPHIHGQIFRSPTSLPVLFG